MDPHIKIDYVLYHNKCAKCKECNTQIDITNFSFIDGVLYCKRHYMSRFMVSGGRYGDAEKFKVSSTPSVAPGFQGVPVIPTVIERKGTRKPTNSTAFDEDLFVDPSAAADSEAPSTEAVNSLDEVQEA